MRAWLILGAAEAVAVALALLPDARTHLTLYILLFAAGSLLALVAARSLSGSTAGFLLLSGALLRATLLFRAPDLSEDWKRFAWDARVASSGVSPYAFAPSDFSVSRIAPESAAALAHAGVRTVYPPVAQAAFRAAGLLGGGALPLKALFAAADLSIVALLLAMGGPGAGFAAALYAFHPLAWTESAGQGHLDSLGIALLLSCLVFLSRGRQARAGVAFALSALTKYVSLVAAPALFFRGRRVFAAAALAAGIAIWIAATRGGVSPLGGMADYAGRWDFNSLAYPALVTVFEKTALPERAKDLFIAARSRIGDPTWTQGLFPFFHAGFFARAALALVLAAGLAWIAWRIREPEAAVFASIGALLLASPTLHPWYLLWVLPFAARRREPAFLYLSFAVPLSYALLYPVPWLTPGLVRVLEYAPFAFLLGPALRRAAPGGEGVT